MLNMLEHECYITVGKLNIDKSIIQENAIINKIVAGDSRKRNIILLTIYYCGLG